MNKTVDIAEKGSTIQKSWLARDQVVVIARVKNKIARAPEDCLSGLPSCPQLVHIFILTSPIYKKHYN